MTKYQKVKISIMGALIVSVVTTMSFVMCRQNNSGSDALRVKNFYKLEDHSLDMVLIGASTAFTDYSAPLAFKEFGFTSYSLATNMAPMGIAKSMLIETLKTQSPKIILIDINGILYNDKLETREGALRLWIDNMPLSQNKINTIQELVPKEEQMAYYFPFLKYHSNWQDLSENAKNSVDEVLNWDNTHLSSMGMQGSTKIDPQKETINIKEHTQTSPMHQISGKRLKELLEYCKNNGLKNIVFTNMPRYYTKKMIPERERNNAAKVLIKEYGYECLDFDDYVKEIGLNPETDFYNQNHLNIYGQKKLTMYLGKLLENRYHLSDTNHDKDVIERYQKEVEGYEKVYNWVDNQMKQKIVRRYDYDVVKKIIAE